MNLASFDDSSHLSLQSVERTSQRAVAIHVMGATQLLKHRGPENHIHGVEHLAFAEMRPYWVCRLCCARQTNRLGGLRMRQPHSVLPSE